MFLKIDILQNEGTWGLLQYIFKYIVIGNLSSRVRVKTIIILR